MVKPLLTLIMIGVAGLILSFPGSRNGAAQIAGDAYKNNNCVECHSKVDQPIAVSIRYAEWQFSKHQEKGVSCDKCHGGDPAVADKKKAHVGVWNSLEVKSRLSRKNQAGTCSACHQQVAAAFVQSMHYQKLTGIGAGPNCNTCHEHMATRVVYSPKRVVALCSSCHNAIDLMPPRPDIPRRASDALLGLQRADGVILWANMLLVEGDRLGIKLTDERTEGALAQQMLSEAKAEWHAFNLEATQKKADTAYRTGARVRDKMRQKLRAE